MIAGRKRAWPTSCAIRKQHPEAIIPDLTKPDPLVTFTKRRYRFRLRQQMEAALFQTERRRLLSVAGAMGCDAQALAPYSVKAGTDWWTAFYPAENSKRPTGALCDGCHSVNYNIETKKVTEWNVGCEKCHGPGSLHVKNPSPADSATGGRPCELALVCRHRGCNVIQSDRIDVLAGEGFLTCRLPGPWHFFTSDVPLRNLFRSIL